MCSYYYFIDEINEEIKIERFFEYNILLFIDNYK